VLWELLAGRRLFSTESPAASIQQLLQAEIERPSRWAPGLPPALDGVVLQALARAPAERFQTARAMAEALERAIAPCSMLELASWVEALAGEELDARSELVFDVESLNFDDFTRALPQSLTLAAAASVAAPAIAEVGVEAGAASLAPSRAPSDGRLRKRWFVRAVSVTIAIAVFGWWVRTRRAPTAARAPIAATHAALPAVPLVGAVVQEPRSDDAARAGAAPAIPSGTSVAARGPRKAPPRAAVSARPVTASDCDVPYVIEQNGVKRFKEACF
ncbi:MAG TPA: hypothetical protein VER04_12300, partial [Polyangiaceae bacterium]|nr:hypothetical protein [Polyangiaceae bacterium]